ncbi:MAG TPA: YfiR family protein, partial [Ignavibacteriaceae bacterium]|nr:YfiR family protein [Ignavibacteriaceae bacterium]
IYESITKSKAKIIFILPLKGIEIKDIPEITKKEKILTFSGIPEYIKNGIAVCLDIKEGKPSIVINLATSKKEGTEFTSQLLNLSRVINN